MSKRVGAAVLLSLAVLLLGTAVGSTGVELRSTLSILGNKLFSLPLAASVQANDAAIVWNLRLPRVLLAFLVGGALAGSGTVVQSVLRNPLASPFTLGVSSGASLGAGIVIIAGFTIPFLGRFTLPTAGLVFGMLTVLAGVTFAARVDRGMSTNTIILAGMVFSLFVNAILSTLTVLFHESLEQVYMWQLGSFAMRGWSYAGGMLPFFVVGITGILLFTRELDLLTFGEEQARAAGVETGRVKWILLLLTAVLTGSAVSFAGVIGFIDLIAPHVVRRIFGSAHRIVLPMSIMFGGVFMVVADLVARTVASPSELPVGIVSALVGEPFFVYVYFRRERRA